ncbi:hypothetical protein QMK33_00410 [Hymenobacter sp. H14-R3]|uniref:hypothetical protein n=1 Tax=Hymenobacter sp. H14-R3 TaxID=3046308 RepID=UPI0024BBE7F3|nr:hypothetical protein [Hymenobacter sp. H14-R3]MDJ0363596.1 hypothetical protein [Hymenobacter sp. H14-R3]
MHTTPMRVPVTHLEAPEVDMPKRPVLVKLTPKNKVKLSLNLMAYDEACGWFGDTIAALGQALQDDPWPAAQDLELASKVYLLLDIHNTQLEPYYLRPAAMKLTLTRAEACLLWRCWRDNGLAANQAPALTEVLHALHQLLA